MKRILKLVGPALAALLLVSFSSPVQAAPAAQDAVGEIIAAYLSGGAGFAAADPEAAARSPDWKNCFAWNYKIHEKDTRTCICDETPEICDE